MEPQLVAGLAAGGLWVLYTLLVQFYRRNKDARWWLVGQAILIILVGAPSFFMLIYVAWPYWGILIAEPIMAIVLWVVLTSGDES